MTTTPSNPAAAEPQGGVNEYEELLGQWSDLQATLAFVLAQPHQIQDFVAKIRQCDRWLQDLVAKDLDATPYLMFQLASTNGAGYSSSHALVCATLCHILAGEFGLPRQERDSLVRAAFTMNVGMTQLQDELAERAEPVNAKQQEAINQHPEKSMALLERVGVTDDLWLDSVAHHHSRQRDRAREPLKSLRPEERLTHMLASVDRYAALISPRKSRAARSATESIRTLLARNVSQSDEVGFILVRTVGLCPPGTFVRLDNGDTAIVLRRSEQTNLPLVASLLDGTGAHFSEPHLHQTSNGKPRIQAAMARAEVKTELNHRTMVRLGLYAVQRSTPLVTQVGLL